jgi:hypothetical protein
MATAENRVLYGPQRDENDAKAEEYTVVPPEPIWNSEQCFTILICFFRLTEKS